MNKEKLQKLAKSLMFKISEKEANIIETDFALFLKQVDTLNKIDTSEVLPLNYPFEEAVGILREDVPTDVLSVAEVLSNTEHTKSNMVKIPKVVV